MLKFLMEVTNDLLFLFLITGFVLALLKVLYKNLPYKLSKRIPIVGLLLGLLASFIRSMIFNNTRVVNGWKLGYTFNYVTFSFIVLSILLLIIFNIKFIRNKITNNKALLSIDIIVLSIASISLGAMYFNPLIDFWFLPYKFYDSELGILSSEYLLNLLGYITGIIVSIISAICAYKVGIVLYKKDYKKILIIATLIETITYLLYLFANIISTAIVRNFIKGQGLFKFSINVLNNIKWFGYIGFILIILISIFLWIQSYHKKEIYANDAEHRKLKVVWRSAKRSGIFALICFVVFILCQTLFVELDKVVIVETPIETAEVIKDSTDSDIEVRVSLDTVSDTHLHKFEYKTAEGYKTRFIIILKAAGTSNYGVGLDACEICGEAGYYENNNNQVVCKKCGVVMNTVTIGMKGGCNPIIIDYDVNDKYITIPVSELVKNQKVFSK